MLQQQIGRERAHHVLGAVREVDDVEHAEDDGEAEAQQRVERAVDQPDQQLAEQRLRGNAEDFEHGYRRTVNMSSAAEHEVREPGRSDHVLASAMGPGSRDPGMRRRRLAGMTDVVSRSTSGQLPSLSGRNASAAGMVARSL